MPYLEVLYVQGSQVVKWPSVVPFLLPVFELRRDLAGDWQTRGCVEVPEPRRDALRNFVRSRPGRTERDLVHDWLSDNEPEPYRRNLVE